MFRQKFCNENILKGGEKKMKKLTSALIILAMMFMPLYSVCNAVTTTGPITVRATIPTGLLEFSWGMAKVDSMLTDDGGNDDVWTPNQTVMEFGTLRHYLNAGNTEEAGLWFSRYYYPIFIGVINTTGAKYFLKHSSNGLSKTGVGKLPKAWGIAALGCWDTAADAWVNCANQPGVGTPGPADTAGVNKILYDSGATTAGVSFRVDYSIPPLAVGGGDPFPGGFAKIPLSQTGGIYEGTLTITITP